MTRVGILAGALAAAAMIYLPSAAARAAAQDDVMQVAHQWAEKFGNGGFGSSDFPCADDAVVIDDFAPHVWQGTHACSRWYQSFAIWAATADVTHAAITLGVASHIEISADFAYLVAPVGLSFLKGARSVKDTGIVTMTLHRDGSGWRISGFAWADQ